MKPELFLPLFDNKRLPYSVRKFFRFGVPPLPEEYKLDHKDKSDSSCDSSESLFLKQKTSSL